MTTWLPFILAHKAAVIGALGILGALAVFARKIVEFAKSLFGQDEKKESKANGGGSVVSGVGSFIGSRNNVSVSINNERTREARAVLTRLSCNPVTDAYASTTETTLTIVNKGDLALTLLRLELVIHGRATMRDCANRRYSLDVAKWTYDFDVDQGVCDGRHSLSPGEVDTFTVRFGRKHGGPTLTTYYVSLYFVFDEVAANFESESFYIDMTGPAYIRGAFSPGTTKQAWCACQAANIRAFEKIERDIRDLFDPEDLPDIEATLRSH